MAAYVVRQADEGGQSRIGGYNAAIVVADSAATAKSIAKALFSNGGDNPNQWAGATVTELATPDSLEGMRFRVLVEDPADDSAVADVTVTAAATDDVDAVGADLVTALNATAAIGNASYSGGTLTIAAIADGIGDHRVSCFCYANTDRHAEDVAIDGVFSSIVDEGIAGAALTVAIAMTVQPHVYAMCKMDAAPVASTAT